MKLHVVGIQRLDFITDDGEEIKGVKIHGIEKECLIDGLLGDRVQSFMVKDDSPLIDAVNTVKIGSNYRVFFAKNSSRVEYLMEEK